MSLKVFNFLKFNINLNYLGVGKTKAVFDAKKSPVRWGNKKCLSVHGQIFRYFSSVYVANLGLPRFFLHSLPITVEGVWRAPIRSIVHVPRVKIN
jgi:hypothetical protein